jgi:hypothetical protein
MEGPMVRWVGAAIAGAVATLIWVVPALAGQPMTFTVVGGLFGVLAEGDIIADTPAQFAAFLRRTVVVPEIVQFNSGGGSLFAALELGREIRRARWETGVATPGLSMLAPRPGECDSACTFAFLGGVTRSMAAGSRFGVHRFWGQSGGDVQQDTQKIAGALVAYIREMGVSTEMYTLMTQGAPEQVKYLDAGTLAQLNVTTTRVVQAGMVDERGVSVLQVTDGDTGGRTTYGSMEFHCNGPRLFARASFFPPMGPYDPSDLALAWVFGPGGRRVSVPREGYRYLGMHDGKLNVDVLVTPALLRDLILPADSIELQLSRPGDTRFQDIQKVWIGGGTVKIPSNFRTLVQTIATSCY